MKSLKPQVVSFALIIRFDAANSKVGQVVALTFLPFTCNASAMTR